MYQQFFGLVDLPFELTPNPRFLFLPPQHQEALSALTYALRYRKPLTVLTGDAGLGKTTLLAAALSRLDVRPARTVVIKNPALTRSEFLETVARGFGIASPANISKATLLDVLEGVLHRTQDLRAVLIADEAHVMPTELLEEIRLLGNIETSTEKLLPVVLVGQPELADRLNEPSLRQLKQRVAVRCALLPLNEAETDAYIQSRLRAAGASNDAVFSREARTLVHRLSRGIPRVINVICDNALLTAFATSQRQVDEAIVAEVASDFDVHDGDVEQVTAVAPLEERRAVTVPLAVEAGVPVVKSAPLPDPVPEHNGATARAHESRALFREHAPARGSFFSRVFSR